MVTNGAMVGTRAGLRIGAGFSTGVGAGVGTRLGRARHVEPPLRLTRRGRAVVLAFLVLLASVASAVLFSTASRAEQSPAGPPPTIVVRPGDTLWDIATQAMPKRDGQAAVEELRRLNGLSSYGVRAGDVLILPRAT